MKHQIYVRMSNHSLPLGPFDGQVFIDALRVKWIFDSENDCWKRVGIVPDIPIASETQAGLLSSTLKVLLDQIPKNGGHFGIVPRHILTLPTSEKIVYRDRVKLAYSTSFGSAIRSFNAFEFDRLKSNEFIDKIIKFTSGSLINKKFLIVRNDESDIFVHNDLSGARSGDEFVILESDYFQNNGILTGDIELVSNSLDISCVDPDDEPIDDCDTICDIDGRAPALDFQISSNFKSLFCATVPGCIGPRGDKGPDGISGKDGTGDGPTGDQGADGEDAPIDPDDFDGIIIVDTDDIYDTAVVDIELDAQNNRLNIVKSKMNTPTSNDVATKMTADPINRIIEFSDDFDYTIIKPDNDSTKLDINLAFLPPGFISSKGQMGAISLSTVINKVIEKYQDKLDEIKKQYETEIIAKAKEKDALARDILANLARDVSDCEWSQPLQFCLGISPEDCGGTIIQPSETGTRPGGSSGELIIDFLNPPIESQQFFVQILGNSSLAANSTVTSAQIVMNDGSTLVATGTITPGTNATGQFVVEIKFDLPADSAGDNILEFVVSANGVEQLTEQLAVSIGSS